MALRPPILGSAAETYDQGTMTRFISELRSYFERSNQPHAMNASTLNINMKTLPTQAALAALSSGDVYVDTSAGNVLKIKP